MQISGVIFHQNVVHASSSVGSKHFPHLVSFQIHDFSGRIGARNLDQLTRKIEEKRQKLKAKAAARQQKAVKGMAQASGGEGSSDHEQDHSKTVSLPPAQVVVGTGERPVVQVSCGLHHTGKNTHSLMQPQDCADNIICTHFLKNSVLTKTF
jgi:hypothetical protein